MSLLLIVAIIIACVVFWKVALKLLAVVALVMFVWEIVLIVQDMHHIVMK